MATGQLPSTLSPSYRLMVRRPSSSRIRRVLVIEAVEGAGRLIGEIPVEAVLGLATGEAGLSPAALVGVADEPVAEEAGKGGSAGGASIARAEAPARPTSAPQLMVRTAERADRRS
jgi:hypothetical protein